MQQEIKRRKKEGERRGKEDSRCAAWVISHDKGPMYWLRKCTKTENYQWKEQGLDPAAPFPYKPWPIESGKLNRGMLDSLPFEQDLTLNDPPDYLDIVMGYLLTSKNLNIPKTREMVSDGPGRQPSSPRLDNDRRNLQWRQEYAQALSF